MQIPVSKVSKLVARDDGSEYQVVVTAMYETGMKRLIDVRVSRRENQGDDWKFYIAAQHSDWQKMSGVEYSRNGTRERLLDVISHSEIKSMVKSITSPPQMTLKEVIDLTREYLVRTDRQHGVELLDKAIDLASRSDAYAAQMNEAIMNGGTVELRELLSEFGDYFEKPRSTFPYYPHHDAVNAVDTAKYHVKIGDFEESVADYNLLNARRDSELHPSLPSCG